MPVFLLIAIFGVIRIVVALIYKGNLRTKKLLDLLVVLAFLVVAAMWLPGKITAAFGNVTQPPEMQPYSGSDPFAKPSMEPYEGYDPFKNPYKAQEESKQAEK